MNICKHTVKMVPHDSWLSKNHQENEQVEEGKEGKEEGIHLRLISGLCLEDKIK